MRLLRRLPLLEMKNSCSLPILFFWFIWRLVLFTNIGCYEGNDDDGDDDDDDGDDDDEGNGVES